MYKDANTRLPIVQVHAEDILQYNLEQSDLGKYCFILQGRFMGFYSSEEETMERVNNLLAD